MNQPVDLRKIFADAIAKTFDPSQPRDAHGRWTEGGGAPVNEKNKNDPNYPGQVHLDMMWLANKYRGVSMGAANYVARVQHGEQSGDWSPVEHYFDNVIWPIVQHFGYPTSGSNDFGNMQNTIEPMWRKEPRWDPEKKRHDVSQQARDPKGTPVSGVHGGGRFTAAGGATSTAPEDPAKKPTPILNPVPLDPKVRAITDLDALDPSVEALPARSRKVSDIAKELEKKAKDARIAAGLPETIGFPAGGNKKDPDPALTEKNKEIIAGMIAAEVQAAIHRSGSSGSHDWYSHKVEEAMKVAAGKHPELANDPDARTAFTACLAITSQGENVHANVRLAEETYAQYKKDGKFPETVVAKKGSYMGGNFAKLNALVKSLGSMDKARDFLMKETTPRALREFGYNIDAFGVDAKVYGSAILGPKIGNGFFQNLNGNYKPVTADLWFMRAWNRLNGGLVGLSDATVLKQKERFIKELINEKKSDPSIKIPKGDAALMASAKEVFAAHEKNYLENRELFDSGDIIKSDLAKAAERVVLGKDGINEQPRGSAQRAWIESVVNRSVEILGKHGIKTTPADLQAAWWYPEKELYSKLGGRDSDGINVNYADAFRDFYAGITHEKPAKKPKKKSMGSFDTEMWAPWLTDPDDPDDVFMTQEEIEIAAARVAAFMAAQEALGNLAKAFNPDQPRDKNGKWTTMRGFDSFGNPKKVQVLKNPTSQELTSFADNIGETTRKHESYGQIEYLRGIGNKDGDTYWADADKVTHEDIADNFNNGKYTPDRFTLGKAKSDDYKYRLDSMRHGSSTDIEKHLKHIHESIRVSAGKLFNPDQRRAPAGTATGGQWTRGSDAPVTKDHREMPAPSHYIEAYKIFDLKDGKLYPTQTKATEKKPTIPTPVGVWLRAEALTGRNTKLAPRYGWHGSELPISPQQRGRNGLMNPNRVWAKIRLAADPKITQQLRARAALSNRMEILNEVPGPGYYEHFESNKYGRQKWLISGGVYVERIMQDEEVERILKKAGRHDDARAEQRGSRAELKAFNPSQARDRLGMWTDGSGFEPDDTQDAEGRYTAIAHREKLPFSDTSEPKYLRFGEPPESGQSVVGRAPNIFAAGEVGKKLPGVSVFPLKFNKERNLWEVQSDDLEESGFASLDELISMQDTHETEQIGGGHKYDPVTREYLGWTKPVYERRPVKGKIRPMYLMTGAEADDVGTDGEPLLKDHKILDRLTVADIIHPGYFDPDTDIDPDYNPGMFKPKKKATKLFDPNQPRDAKGRWVDVWHGSGKDFDQFSTDKIGDGQGAQAYGWGLYFAENPDVAASYRQELGGMVAHTNGEIAADIQQAMGSVYQYFANMYPSKFVARDINTNTVMQRSMTEHIMEEIAKGHQREQEVADAVARTTFNPGGKMYQVRIHADPETFMDWDKPLKDQSPAVRDTLIDFANSEAAKANAARASSLARGHDFMGKPYKPEKIEKLKEIAVGEEYNGAQIYTLMQRNLGAIRQGQLAKETSLALLKQGISGIRYLDQGSRDTGHGTRNYVLFDASKAEILGKKRFNPDQPRAPAGSPGGGRWTVGGGPLPPTDEHGRWNEGSPVAAQRNDAIRASALVAAFQELLYNENNREKADRIMEGYPEESSYADQLAFVEDNASQYDMDRIMEGVDRRLEQYDENFQELIALAKNPTNADYTFFHGTSDAAIVSIMKNGLIPHGSDGAEAYAAKSGMTVFKSALAGRDASVYFTPDPDYAKVFAEYAKEATGSRPAVLQIRIPADRIKDVVLDENAPDGGMRLKGRIPPEWIHNVTPPAGIKSAGDLILYMVIPCTEGGKSGFNPREARDWRGRWTTGGGGPKHYLLPAVRFSGGRDRHQLVTVVGRSHQDAHDRVPLGYPDRGKVEGFVNERREFLRPDEAAVHASVYGLHDGSPDTIEALTTHRRLKDEHLRRDTIERAMRVQRDPPEIPGKPGRLHAVLEPNAQDEGKAPAQLSWEAAPGMTSGIFPEFHNAPRAQREEFQKAVEEVVAPGGEDQIVKEMHLKGGGTFSGEGVFEGRTNPGAQSQVEFNSFKLAPRDIELLNGVEAIRGKLLHQDAAAWHRPAFDPQRFAPPFLVPALRGKSGRYWLGRTHNEAYANMPEDDRIPFDRRQDYDAFRYLDPNGMYLKRDDARKYAADNGLLNAHGQNFEQRDLIAEHLTPAATAPADRMDRDKANLIDFRIGRQMSQEEAVRVTKQLASVADGFFSPIATQNGFRLLNVPEVTGIDNRAFQSKIIATLNEMEPGSLPAEIKAHLARADSGYISNDWKADPHGENYDRTIDAAGSYVQGVSQQVFAKLSPKLDAVYADFAKRYGWTGWPPGRKGADGSEELKVFDLPEIFWLNGRRYEYAGRLFFKDGRPRVEICGRLDEYLLCKLIADFDGEVKRYNPQQARVSGGHGRESGRWTRTGAGLVVPPAGGTGITPVTKPPLVAVTTPPIIPVAQKLIAPVRAKMPKTPKEIETFGDRIARQLGVYDTFKKIREDVAKETQTVAPVSEGGHKVSPTTYDPERQKLHHEILSKIFNLKAVKAATPKKGQKPTLVIIGGRGGSGKSFITDPKRGGPVDPKHFIKLDADEIKAQLTPEYKGWNAFTVHEESGEILDHAVGLARLRGLNLIIDETMKSPGKAQKRIEPFEKAGYHVDGYYAFATPEEACKRAIKRYIDGQKKDGKGRAVLPEVVLANQKNEENFDSVIPRLRRWAVYNMMGPSPVRVAGSKK